MSGFTNKTPTVFKLAEEDLNAQTQKLQFDSFKFKDHELLNKNNSSSPLVNSKDDINTVLLPPEIQLKKKDELMNKD